VRVKTVRDTARGPSTVIMAGVLAAFGNMFAFKGSFQAEVRDWPVKGRVLRHGMEGHTRTLFFVVP
tara:strand:- start:967 stop:1164 length:198 start_codon:yes stop_codon:yes gene_type:complete